MQLFAALPQSKEWNAVRGKVKWFDAQKGYGFIEREGEKDVFVHFSAIQQKKGYKQLFDGEEVEYDLADTDRGPQAHHVKRLEVATEERWEAVAPAAKRESGHTVERGDDGIAVIIDGREVIGGPGATPSWLLHQLRAEDKLDTKKATNSVKVKLKDGWYVTQD